MGVAIILLTGRDQNEPRGQRADIKGDYDVNELNDDNDYDSLFLVQTVAIPMV